MPVPKRFVQSAYITFEARDALNREAQRQNLFPSTLASEILEKKAKEILRKEQKDDKDPQV